MKILGTVLHTSSHRNLVIRGDETEKIYIKSRSPGINSIVFDKKKKKIGKINDIFGPVKHPYFSVKLFKNVTNEYLRGFKNKNVYVN
ncbi:MAG: H/ACA RNA-protein complex protein Gar1 [Methanosarcinales archaeon]|nr:H/ACA RNA-protein complex protein Gar1 [Methanosarcinales archaeon]